MLCLSSSLFFFSVVLGAGFSLWMEGKFGGFMLPCSFVVLVDFVHEGRGVKSNHCSFDIHIHVLIVIILEHDEL